MTVRGEAEKVVAPTEDEIADWHAFYVFFKRLHQGWHDDALEFGRLTDDSNANPFHTADTLPSVETEKALARSMSPPASVQKASTNHSSNSWRRGDYFFCEGCGTRKQWWKDSPPWRGAICASCYNAELARIEAARGRKA